MRPMPRSERGRSSRIPGGERGRRPIGARVGVDPVSRRGRDQTFSAVETTNRQGHGGATRWGAWVRWPETRDRSGAGCAATRNGGIAVLAVDLRWRQFTTGGSGGSGNRRRLIELLAGGSPLSAGRDHRRPLPRRGRVRPRSDGSGAGRRSRPAKPGHAETAGSDGRKAPRSRAEKLRRTT